jgi:bacterioferritin-associated ferredoxin
MIVCICLRVSDRDIAREVRDGCASFDALQLELGVGTRCGACTDCARKTFSACHGKGSVSPVRASHEHAAAPA